jgi:hypothetical protein
MNHSISKLAELKKIFYLLKIKISILNNPNNLVLGRWCSCKKENNTNVCNRIFELGNSDNCYISNYSIKTKKKSS